MRIYYAMGRDHALFAIVGRWSQRFGTPAWSLMIQAVCTLLAVVGFGMTGEGPEGSGFQRLIDFTTPVFWFFLLLTGVSLLLLRVSDATQPRPFRVPGYPVVALAVFRRCRGDRLCRRQPRHRGPLLGGRGGGGADGTGRCSGVPVAASA